MPKEPYVKPEVKSETLEPEALACVGSDGGSNGFMVGKMDYFSAGLCCGHDVL